MLLAWLVLSRVYWFQLVCRLQYVLLLQLLPDAVDVLQAWVVDQGRGVQGSQQPLLLLLMNDGRMICRNDLDFVDWMNDVFGGIFYIE